MARKTYLQALNDAMRQEMERDPNVFILGEDVGKFGGCFGVTRGFMISLAKGACVTPPSAKAPSWALQRVLPRQA